MNAWILTSEFPPDFGGGGISAYCIHFAKSLQQHGHRVTVFTRASETQDQVTEDSYDGIPVVRIPPRAPVGVANSLGHWHLLSYAFAEEVVSRLGGRGERPDFIEVQDYGGLGYFLQKRKLTGEILLDGIPIVVMCHTPTFEIAQINEEPSYRFPTYWIGRSEKFSLLAADHVISPSRFLADRLSREVGCHVDVLPLPAPTKPISEPALAVEGRTDLLYVGRFEVRKGVLDLVDAMRRLWDAGSRLKLTMTGGDTHWAARGITVRSYLEEQFHQYIQAGVLELQSQVPHSQVPQLMRSAKAVIIPSLYENFPYVCIEAMSAGLPVIASISGGQAEMVGDDDSCGRLFSWDDPGTFDSAVLSLLSLSEGERRKLGENARARVSHMCDAATYVEERLRMAKAVLEKNTVLANYPFLNEHVEPKGPLYRPVEAEGSVKGLLSVIVPYFNLGEFIRDTINSICDSTYEHIEILIVNDGSTDPLSIRELDAIGSEDWRFPVRTISIVNSGLPTVRNLGAREAKGEYISFLDADDTVRPLYYEQCVRLLDRYSNCSFVYSWVQFFGGSDDIWINFDTELPYMLAGNMLASYQVMRRGDFLAYGQNNVKMRHGTEDYEAWLRMVGNGCLGISIPETLVDYRVRPSSMSRTGDRNTVLLMRERMVDLNSALYDRWGSAAFQLVSANGPGWLWSNGSLDYPPVGHVGGAVSPSQLSSLRWKFSPEHLRQVAEALDDPSVVWAATFLMRTGLYRIGLRFARIAKRIRDRVRR